MTDSVVVRGHLERAREAIERLLTGAGVYSPWIVALASLADAVEALIPPTPKEEIIGEVDTFARMGGNAVPCRVRFSKSSHMMGGEPEKHDMTLRSDGDPSRYWAECSCGWRGRESRNPVEAERHGADHADLVRSSVGETPLEESGSQPGLGFGQGSQVPAPKVGVDHGAEAFAAYFGEAHASFERDRFAAEVDRLRAERAVTFKRVREIRFLLPAGWSEIQDALDSLIAKLERDGER